MDVTITIKVTPAEARQLAGLPDLHPLQDAALAKIQQKIMEEAEKFSPAGLLNTWFSGGSGAVDLFRDMTRGILSQVTPRDKSESKSKETSRE